MAQANPTANPITFNNNTQAVNYPNQALNAAKPSLDREAAQVESIKAQAQLHIAQAEAARANGQSEVANAPLVRDLLRVLREREKEQEEKENDVDETRYVDLLRQNQATARTGELISFVASFASQEPHDLISPSAKQRVRMSRAIGNLQNEQWNFFVSAELEAHAIEVASMISTRFHNLKQAEAGDFINTGDQNVRVRFHRAVASMYRGSSVFSVRRYSTTKAIETLQSNISHQIRYFSCVKFVDGELRSGLANLAPLPRDLYGI